MWVKAELNFASFFSYRIPGTSPSYTPASPVPSPVALRLALVDAALQRSGRVDYGRDIFHLIRVAPLEVVPPPELCLVRIFLKRLKPRGGELLESTGVREYCLLLGPLTVYLKLHSREMEIVKLWQWIRRLGTTDSLLTATACTIDEEPPKNLCWQELPSLPVVMRNFQRRFVSTLIDLGDSSFDQVSPYIAGTPRYKSKTYVLPLVLVERGENWRRYCREPFELP